MARKTRGVLYLASAAVLAVAGVVLLGFNVTPPFVAIALNAITAVLAILGIPIVAKPDVS